MNRPKRYLPELIIYDILKRLPVKLLLKFRLVSKPWKRIIDSTGFIKSHYTFAIENSHFNLLLSDAPGYDGLIKQYLLSINHQNYTEASEIVDYPYKDLNISVSGSCNGLVFLRSDEFDLIWNPSTKESKKLPADFVMPNNLSGSVKIGFGYSSALDDYKVVKVSQFYDDNNYLGAEARLYSLSSDSWKVIASPGFDLGTRYYSTITTNSHPHWLAADYDRDPTTIAGFDLDKEIFQRIPNPREVTEVCTAGFLRGHLCILEGDPNEPADVWVMKKYGVEDSWEKIFTIPSFEATHSPRYLWVLFPTEGNKVILMNHDTQLVLYDPELDEPRVLPISGLPYEEAELQDFYLTTYVGSLVSLRSRTSVDRVMPVTEPIEKNGEEGGDDMLLQNDAEA